MQARVPKLAVVVLLAFRPVLLKRCSQASHTCAHMAHELMKQGTENLIKQTLAPSNKHAPKGPHKHKDLTFNSFHGQYKRDTINHALQDPYVSVLIWGPYRGTLKEWPSPVCNRVCSTVEGALTPVKRATYSLTLLNLSTQQNRSDTVQNPNGVAVKHVYNYHQIEIK